MASAKREKLYPTPKECYDRDHERRQEGAPHRADPFYRAPARPLESGLTSDGEEGYAFYRGMENVGDDPDAVAVYNPAKKGMPTRATLGPDGRLAWQPGMELRICGRETPVARDWITPGQVAELLEFSDAHTWQLVREGTIPSYRPGGEHGRPRIHIAVLVSYCKRNGMPEEKVAQLEAMAHAMVQVAPVQDKVS